MTRLHGSLLVCLLVVESATGSDHRLDLQGDPLPSGAVARLGTLRWRLPTDDENFRCWFKDAQILIIARWDGDWYACDLTTGTLKPLPRKRRGWVTKGGCTRGGICEAISVDRRVYATGDSAGVVEIDDAATGASQRSWRAHDEAIRWLALSRDGERLATRSNDQTVVVWDTRSGRILRRLDAPTQLTRGFPIEFDAPLAMSEDGTLVAWAGKGNDHSVHVCDALTGAELHRFHTEDQTFEGLTFSPDGRSLAGATLKGTVFVWDIVRGAQRQTLAGEPAPPFRPSSLLFSRDGRWLLSWAFDCPACLFDLSTGQEHWRTTPTRYGRIGYGQVALSPDGKSIVTLRPDRVIQRYGLRTGKRLSPDDGHLGAVAACWFSRDGNSLITFAGDRMYRSWRADTGVLVKTDWAARGGWPLGVSPEHQLVLNYGESLKLYDLTTGAEHSRRPPHPDTTAVGFSPGGEDVVTAGDDSTAGGVSANSIVLSSRAGEKERWRTRIGRELAFHVFYASDGRVIVCEADQSGAIAWSRFSVATGRQLTRRVLPKEMARTMAISADHRMMVFAPREHENGLATHVTFYEVATLQPRCRIGPGKQVTEAEFSPDESLLATGTSDGAWQLWDPYSGKCLQEHRGHWGPVTDLAFSDDGRRLATASDDTTVLIWPLVAPARAAARPASAGEAVSLWEDLKSTDAGKAYRAIGRLVEMRESGVNVLRDRLSPASPPEWRRLSKGLENLKSSSFATRERASRELAGLGLSVQADLEKALASASSPDTQQRIRQILRVIDESPSSPEELRSVRSIEVLELIGTESARQVLRKLAAGEKHAPLTCEASASLARLSRRGK